MPKFLDVRKNRGAPGEEAAAAYLRRQGYEIVERNLRLAGSEIDIVARCGPMLAFVEVKTRRSAGCGAPEAFVGSRKRRGLIRAVKLFMTRPAWAGLQPRLDVIAVCTGAAGGGPTIEHFPGAIEE